MRTLKTLWPLLLLVALFSGFTPHTFIRRMHAETLLNLGSRLRLSRGGALLALTYLLRIMNMIAATQWYLAKTDPDDAFAMLRKLRLPAVIGFSLSTALRYIPVLERRRREIGESRRCRGGRAAGTLKSGTETMLALMVSGLGMSGNLSIALVSRGFGHTGKITAMRTLRFSRRDYLLMTAATASIAASVALRLFTAFGRL